MSLKSRGEGGAEDIVPLETSQLAAHTVTSVLQGHKQEDQKFKNSRSFSVALDLSQGKTGRKGEIKVFFDKEKLRESVVIRLALK